MSDPNPLIRSRALEHFRKSVGLEGSGGVHVNVNQQTAVIQNGQVRSFEVAPDAVRCRHAKTEIDRNAIPETIASSSAEPLTDSASAEVTTFESELPSRNSSDIEPHPAY